LPGCVRVQTVSIENDLSYEPARCLL
jgi:hypothetical protein